MNVSENINSSSLTEITTAFMVTEETSQRHVSRAIGFETTESILTISRKFAVLEFVYICAKVASLPDKFIKNPI